MPCIRKKSGIPRMVKVLKRVAAKVIKPSAAPILDPANKKSEEVWFFFLDHKERDAKKMMYMMLRKINHLFMLLHYFFQGIPGWPNK